MSSPDATVFTQAQPGAPGVALQDIKIRPTLFIGLGGTGLEVMLRIRRRLLNATWGRETPLKLASLEQFPVAQFLYVDLAKNEVIETGMSTVTDVLFDLVKLKENDRICETLDLAKYSASDQELDKYPHIKSWSPLTPQRIRELGIDPSKGAGQIRAISRLYFHDYYTAIRDHIRDKIHTLKNNLDAVGLLQDLGLEIETGKYRVIVVCSVAGGTGAGCFLDMGWLARWIAKSEVGDADVELIMFLPSGYSHAGKTRTEANGYASLMELETCMQGGTDYVGQWDPYDKPALETTPYSEVYLVDSSNLGEQSTGNQEEVYEMVADVLFEDFLSSDFATKKRSAAVNQQQQKLFPFDPPLGGIFGDTKLRYSRVYSALGQAVLDTQLGVRRNEQIYRWMAGMLKAFFGVAGLATTAPQATTEQRDWVMENILHLSEVIFKDFPKALKRLKLSPIPDYQLTDDLLIDGDGTPIVTPIRSKVTAVLETIKRDFPDHQRWPDHIRKDVLPRLVQDVIKGINVQAENVQDQVTQRRKEMSEKFRSDLRQRFYTYLDNREYGGLEFVLTLTRQIQERLRNPDTGVIAELKRHAERYEGIKTEVQKEIDKRLDDLGGIGTGFIPRILSDPRTQAEIVLTNLGTEIHDYLLFHLRAKAAEEAAELLRKVDRYLGEQQEMDETGQPRWTGLIGEFLVGRESVLDLLANTQRGIDQLRQEMGHDHATYLRVTPPDRYLTGTTTQQSAQELGDWAEEAFKDYGGSEKLFQVLQDKTQRRVLFRKLYAHASRRLPMPSTELQEDPLIEALKGMTHANERSQLFGKWLRLAMPWVNANFAGDFKPDPAQYYLFIGVSQAQAFDPFKNELLAQLPPGCHITTERVHFVDTGITGRAVCYVELSGMPLYVLRGLDTWRSSYRIESEKIPVHTHRDPTRFIHPRLTIGDLTSLAEDFQTYLLAVAIGVLERNPKEKTWPPGLYRFEYKIGDKRDLGNERAFRLNGLPSVYAFEIREQINNQSMDPIQSAALAELFGYYAMNCYKPPLVSDQLGKQSEIQGFASAMARRLEEQFAGKARDLGVEEAVFNRLKKTLEQWTEGIPGSIKDAYPREIDLDKAQNKRRVKKEFLQNPEWIRSVIGIETTVPGAVSAPMQPVSPPPLTNAPFVASHGVPPTYQYWLVLNGQQSGPHPFAHVKAWLDQGQIPANTLAWREGLPQQWQPISQIPEFALPPPPFGAATPPPVPSRE
ncbi:MAG: DUF4339 domain-containing protein [Deltaproteobacteria bacterium]|nr:MAG: DUF4339 domain-containing protein [Deltaproteobacteria bacterium]